MCEYSREAVNTGLWEMGTGTKKSTEECFQSDLLKLLQSISAKTQFKQQLCIQFRLPFPQRMRIIEAAAWKAFKETEAKGPVCSAAQICTSQCWRVNSHPLPSALRLSKPWILLHKQLLPKELPSSKQVGHASTSSLL